MLPYRDSRITKVALLLFFLIIAGYGYFEARGILFGPSIKVESSVQNVSNPYIEIKGTASHISSLEMNGQSVAVTENGQFDIPFVLAPGFNRIVLDAQDKYGKKTEQVIEIVYTESSTSTGSIIATSTPFLDASSSLSTPSAATSTTVAQ